MKLKCLLGFHNYGDCNDITVVEKISNPGENICVWTCNRICTRCNKKILLQKLIDTMNPNSTTRWRRIPSSYYNSLLVHN